MDRNLEIALVVDLMDSIEALSPAGLRQLEMRIQARQALLARAAAAEAGAGVDLAEVI